VIEPTAELTVPRPVLDATTRRAARSYWRESLNRLLENRIGMACGLVILVLALIAVTAPLTSAYLFHYNYSSIDLSNTFGKPSAKHLLGTDELGRDTLVRLMYGSQVSLIVAFVGIGTLLFVGGTVGIVAGFYGGIVDTLLMRFVDILLSIPTIYLLILVSILHPFGLSPARPGTLAVLIAVVSWGGVARLVRGEVLSVKQRDFMLATRSIGASNFRLMLRHLLPNVLAVMIVAGSLGMGTLILTEAILSFIGLGIQPPLPSWGNMLTNAQTYIYNSLWLVNIPGITIFVTVLCANIFGNAVRDAFDPRLSGTE
jgi:peptide/nickel transport system permease protein